jgi:hypothetical protein
MRNVLFLQHPVRRHIHSPWPSHRTWHVNSIPAGQLRGPFITLELYRSSGLKVSKPGYTEILAKAS